ncbi:MAG: riboflavin synthase [Flavobacteriales bacterium]|nr:riboflavin synthase [Flavobacteriales bacterium]MBL0035267.1 riboflavin synthase [Flavobacteriales bacterium]
MFTGIVEEVAEVVERHDSGTNRDLIIRASMTPQLKVDQSVSHNGVCLTVVSVSTGLDVTTGTYRVTAVKETLERSNLGDLKPGDGVNLERSLRIGDRLDGHMVQGHVDTVTQCLSVEDVGGSWRYTFRVPDQKHLLVHKGSICLNGVSLTIAELEAAHFAVAIIPYTYEHTTFRALTPGHRVNVEFDVLGKYVERMLQR